MKRRFESGDTSFEALKQQWLIGTRKVFHDLPPLQWQLLADPVLRSAADTHSPAVDSAQRFVAQSV